MVATRITKKDPPGNRTSNPKIQNTPDNSSPGNRMSFHHKIPVANWRKQKLTDVLSQVDSMAFLMFDSLIFETIIDFVREEYGFPGALPLRDFTQTSPIVPSPTYSLPVLPSPPPSEITCPGCNAPIEPRRFYDHAQRCARTASAPVEAACEFFARD
jgi:hypothetical protein